MHCWDESTFNEHLGNKTEWGIIVGPPLSGKSLIAGIVEECTNGKVIDVPKLAESIKGRLGTDEGPFEDRVPDAEVEKDILEMIEADKASGESKFYLIDGQHHETVEAATNFFLTNMNAPTCLINCSADP